MERELTPSQKIEQSISRTYRKRLWNPFITAVKRYELIAPGDHIAACISGGKDSMLMAKLLQMLKRYSEVPYDLTFLVMDPGYRPNIREKIEENAETLGLPVTVFETDIFEAAESVPDNPCYLCARMRRGHLYSRAKELGCNKIALGHHLNDSIETVLMSMFYGSQIQTMAPMIRSQNFPGMSLIRPMYGILEEDIIAWSRHNGLTFIQCACRMTEKEASYGYSGEASKRQEVKNLIRELKKTNPEIERNMFNSLHNVNIDMFPEFKTDGKYHSFLEKYYEKD